ncbi:GGDEF domain-containing protein [Cellulomonas humilata]|uniref:Diguanylate cyclase (GGDEF)-like protein n=1 Tax=Cellulomonas humilata TaxID=144055 RepID=A0ABU0EKE5_9CELL|nr:GGDEF domain-containing protein [Cellulomonas humilata]MDQ0375761.1 diguanylate cyclase (GGDEF)-like protein [Cellulomonas humilata]
MHADLTLLTQRLGNAVGGYKVAATTTVADLAHAVDVVDAGMPVARLELIFRSPHVASVAVRDPDDDRRIGLVTRTRFTAAMTGRLGFGRAVLARRGTDELTDWGPMVVPPTAPVSEVAVRAMQRFDERRYDDVLVADESWGVVSTADLVRSLSTLLAVRSLHDPLTALPHRSMAMHELTRRCAESAGTGARVVVVLLDIAGFSRLNSTYGPAVGDIVLAGVGARLAGGLPGGCQAARTAGDEFAVIASLPGVASDQHAAALVDGLRRDVLALLAQPQAGIDPSAWPAFHSAAAFSGLGSADAEHLVASAQRRLRSAKESASVGGGLADELRGILTGDLGV